MSLSTGRPYGGTGFVFDPSFSHDSSYTRSCEKRGSYSLIDFIFFSRSLGDYDGRNPSDHFPSQMSLDIVPHSTGDGSLNVKSHIDRKVYWSSLKSEDISNYERTMEQLLESIVVPSEIMGGYVLYV